VMRPELFEEVASSDPGGHGVAPSQYSHSANGVEGEGQQVEGPRTLARFSCRSRIVYSEVVPSFLDR